MLEDTGLEGLGYYFEEEEKYDSRVQPFEECQVERPQGRTLTKGGKLEGDGFGLEVKKKCLTIRTTPEHSKLSLGSLVGVSDDHDNFHLLSPSLHLLSIYISTSSPLLKMNPPLTPYSSPTTTYASLLLCSQVP